MSTPTSLNDAPVGIFDSGLGGLTVCGEVARLLSDAQIIYAADNAAFPYGELGEDALVARSGGRTAITGSERVKMTATFR